MFAFSMHATVLRTDETIPIPLEIPFSNKRTFAGPLKSSHHAEHLVADAYRNKKPKDQSHGT